MPDQGCRSIDVCRGSRQSGSKGKLTLETILLTAVWANLPVFLDEHVGDVCTMAGYRRGKQTFINVLSTCQCTVGVASESLIDNKEGGKKDCSQYIVQDLDAKITTTTTSEVKAIWSICWSAATSSCN